MIRGLVMAIAMAAAVGSASAQTVYTYSGPLVPIPDNLPDGVNLDINVPDVIGLAQFVSVDLFFSTGTRNTATGGHSWVGDLSASLTHVPSGLTSLLFVRPGKTSPTTGFGDSSNMFGGPYTFSNVLPTGTFARLIEAANSVGGTNDPTGDVPLGVYRPTNNTFNGDPTPTFTGEVIQNLNGVFDGLADMSGIWRLNVSDNASGDIGAISSFSITLTAVPEPSSMVFGGLVVVGGIGRWLKRRKTATA